MSGIEWLRSDTPAVLPHRYQEITAMDKDRIIGAAKEAKGTVKEAVGKVIGDAKLQADGRTEIVEGKVQNAIGGLHDTVRDILKK